jgi:hypothetical protein
MPCLNLGSPARARERGESELSGWTVRRRGESSHRLGKCACASPDFVGALELAILILETRQKQTAAGPSRGDQGKLIILANRRPAIRSRRLDADAYGTYALSAASLDEHDSGQDDLPHLRSIDELMAARKLDRSNYYSTKRPTAFSYKSLYYEVQRDFPSYRPRLVDLLLHANCVDWLSHLFIFPSKSEHASANACFSRSLGYKRAPLHGRSQGWYPCKLFGGDVFEIDGSGTTRPHLRMR